MPDYPRAFTIEPIGEWPGELTTHRVSANFRTPGKVVDGRYTAASRVPIGKTMRELATELEQLKATTPRLLVAVNSTDITLDGRLKAGRKPWHPGVVLVFDSPRGEQRYPSDQYTHWEDNLRAIALTLNALRGVERWGVGAGSQYTGYLAIESAIAVPAAPFNDATTARVWLAALCSAKGSPTSASEDPATLIRKAQRFTHPDHGGDPEQFRLVSLAEGYLREAMK